MSDWPINLDTPQAQAIATLCRLGSSLTLTWDEESEVWHVEWVTSGRRYSSEAVLLLQALVDVAEEAAQARERYLKLYSLGLYGGRDQPAPSKENAPPEARDADP